MVTDHVPIALFCGHWEQSKSFQISNLVVKLKNVLLTMSGNGGVWKSGAGMSRGIWSFRRTNYSLDVLMDKAPGTDEHTMGFCLNCWEVIKTDIFHNFHSNSMFEKSFNATSIALILILRRRGQRSSKIFRSISLIENFYKLISNVLTEIEEAGGQTTNDIH